MPLGIWSVEWNSLNGQRNYPLADDASCLDATGSFRLPTDFVVGMDLPYDAGLAVDPSKFFILSVGSFAGGYSVTVGYDTGGDPEPAAVATVPRAGHQRNASYPLSGVGPFASTRGTLQVGVLDSVDAQPPGLFTFDPDGGRIDPDAVRPALSGVSALYLVNGSDVVGPLTGVVRLAAGTNFRLELTNDGGPTVVFNAVSGEGTSAPCACPGDSATAPPVRTINGVSAEHFTIQGDDCYEVTATGSGIKIVDKCSRPCCSCPELEAVTRDLQRYKAQQDTLSAFVTELSAAARQMDLVVLGSRLGDRGCGQCG